MGGAFIPALDQGLRLRFRRRGLRRLAVFARRAAGNTQGLGQVTGKEKNMGTLLIIILVLVVVGALPTWPHSRSWGYYPSSGLGLILLILIILLLLGRI